MSELITPPTPPSARSSRHVIGREVLALAQEDAIQQSGADCSVRAARTESSTSETNDLSIWQATLSILRTFGDNEIHPALRLFEDRGLLRDGSGTDATPCPKRKSMLASVVFSHIERAGPKAIWVSWHEATLGRYSEQRWVLCVSRNRGICALSGKPIRRGDIVYRPSSRVAVKPCNMQTMIIGTSVESHLAHLAGFKGSEEARRWAGNAQVS
ncbi:hypothetical protein R69608_03249 [Paraburkholderia nemoris]|uniref:DUF3331 domain-containing protein n=1 Tax=Paraburkholderia nemoris TaxID=2793076 RepID=UPI001913BC71|nr:DUF3331 domain-containing protein [Burkholderia sp. R-69608]CAE6906575.1 hypothetical protein R69608_03249 [Paraburkholderia nemoris]